MAGAIEVGATSDWSSDLRTVLRWLSLGFAAGGLAGLAIGGVVGRLVMFALRLTSSDSVHGVTSDHGFEIGIISAGTAFLLVVTTALGVVGGITYVVARRSLPERLRVPAWTLLGGLVGGAAIIEADGVDFTRLEPRAGAVVAFILIPAAGSYCTAALIERWAPRWGRRRLRAIAASLPAAPTLLFLPLTAALTVGTVLTVAAAQVQVLRRGAGSLVVRGAVLALLAWIAIRSGVALADDIDAVFN